MKLFAKIFIVINLIIILVLMVVYFSNVYYLKYYTSRLVISDLKELTERISNVKSVADVNDILKVASSNEINMVIKYNNSSFTVKQTGVPMPPDLIFYAEERLKYKDEDEFQYVHPAFRGTFVVVSQKYENGYIIAGTLIPSFNKAIRVISHNMFLIVVVFTAIGVLLSYVFTKYFTTRIKIISESAHNIIQGKELKVLNSKDELGELSHTIKILKDSLGRLENMRRDFIANFSHDIKTPVAVIRAYAETTRLIDINNEENIKNNMLAIENECRKIEEMINQMVELVKLSSKKVRVNWEELDLGFLVRNILNKMSKLFELNGKEVSQQIPSEPVIIRSDAFLLERVFYNILYNAAIHSTEKTIKIDMQVNNGETVVFIKNYTDIKEEDLPFIFDKYDREGHGLGLTIVREILNLLNIDYNISIENGIFIFSLKIKRA